MPILQTDTNNKQFQLAADYIIQTNKSLFLTGKAGTGKTTFLKYIKEKSTKNTAIVAPTGVAAINAGGVTIHSFFQLPLSPFIPEQKQMNTSVETMNKHSLLGRIRFNTEKRNLLHQLELLIIDEISMVRCDTLDAIDVVLRSFRNRHSEPFGGVQLLFIGDMFQLPPVVPNEEWNILSQVYSNPFFFSSKVMQQLGYVYIELNKIYRQSDDVFIKILNQVRNNDLDEEGTALLHSRYNPAFTADKEDGYIILTTHNYKADAINVAEMNKLNTKSFISKAVVDGEFYERSYPAEENLQLKIDAQVMFIKNDTDKAKRFFNGKIGTVNKIENDKVFIVCKNEAAVIEVKKETWKNVRYNLNKQTQQIEEEEIGSFTQFPLRLAWAITIHKSQGLTFEKAIIDAGASFAPGQVYVALSRCTCLQGIVLLSRIYAAGLLSDERILQFVKANKNSLLYDDITPDKHNYQKQLLLSFFNFKDIHILLYELIKILEEHASSFNQQAIPWLQSTEVKLQAIVTTAQKFEPALILLLEEKTLPEENSALQKRLQGASGYFVSHLQILINNLKQSPAITDSRQYAIAYNEALKEFYTALSQKLNVFSGMKDGFNVDVYYNYKKQFQPQPFAVNAYAGATYKKTDSPHPALHKELRQLRDDISNKNNLPIYLVAGSATLDEMACYLPQTIEELLLISGFGKAKAERFGKQFLEIIIDYSLLNNLSSLIHEKQPKRIRKTKTDTEPKTAKPDTKVLTYQLYKAGKNIKEICVERNLAPQTVESHIAHFVQQGDIKIDELVSREKFLLIEPAVRNYEGTTLTPVKQQLGNDVSYGEIKLVMAAVAFEKMLTNNNK